MYRNAKRSKKNRARIGDIIVVFVQDALPNSKVSGGDVVRAVIVGSKVGVRRKDGILKKKKITAILLCC